jgi:hypothetical protein
MQPRKAAGKLLMKRFLKVDDPTVIEPWQTLLAQNTAGLTPRGLPVFIAQGMADDTVVPSNAGFMFERHILSANGLRATLA